MTNSLATTYRPSTFEGLVGQRMVSVILKKMVAEEEVPDGLLFTGIHGVGKTSTARILAAALNCTGEGEAPCNECESCLAVRSGTSMDVIEVDAASRGSVEAIRELIESLRYQYNGKYRVVILDEAQSMSKAAYNALLKTLEEPPNGTIFVLVTTEPHKIPETVKSRLIEFPFKRISPNEIFDYLVGLDTDVDLDLVAHLAQEAGGSMRNALMSMDMIIRAEVVTLEEYRSFIGESDTGPIILQSLLTADTAYMMSTLDEQLMVVGDPELIHTGLIDVFRDLLVIRAGGKTEHSGAEAESRHNLAMTLDTTQVVTCLKLLWSLKLKIGNVHSPRSYLEMALILLAEQLTMGREPAKVPQKQDKLPSIGTVPHTVKPTRKLSMSEMIQKSKSSV